MERAFLVVAAGFMLFGRFAFAKDDAVPVDVKMYGTDAVIVVEAPAQPALYLYNGSVEPARLITSSTPVVHVALLRSPSESGLERYRIDVSEMQPGMPYRGKLWFPSRPDLACDHDFLIGTARRPLALPRVEFVRDDKGRVIKTPFNGGLVFKLRLEDNAALVSCSLAAESPLPKAAMELNLDGFPEGKLLARGETELLVLGDMSPEKSYHLVVNYSDISGKNVNQLSDEVRLPQQFDFKGPVRVTLRRAPAESEVTWEATAPIQEATIKLYPDKSTGENGASLTWTPAKHIAKDAGLRLEAMDNKMVFTAKLTDVLSKVEQSEPTVIEVTIKDSAGTIRVTRVCPQFQLPKATQAGVVDSSPGLEGPIVSYLDSMFPEGATGRNKKESQKFREMVRPWVASVVKSGLGLFLKVPTTP